MRDGAEVEVRKEKIDGEKYVLVYDISDGEEIMFSFEEEKLSEVIALLLGAKLDEVDVGGEQPVELESMDRPFKLAALSMIATNVGLEDVGYGLMFESIMSSGIGDLLDGFK